MISYRSSLRFVPVQWFLAELWPLDFEILPNISCHHFFSLCLEILTWFLVYECIMISYRSSLHFVPVQWFLAELWPLDFEIWPNIFTMIWDIDLIFGMRVYNHKLQINFEIHLLFLAYYWGNWKRVKHLLTSLIFTAETFVAFRHF
jgi:hypothetical protein